MLGCRFDLFHFLLGHSRIVELAVAYLIAIGHIQCSLAAGKLRIGQLERKLVAGLINAENHLTLLDRLIVMNQNFAHQTGNVRSDAHDICTYLAVTCPWRVHVIVP